MEALMRAQVDYYSQVQPVCALLETALKIEGEVPAKPIVCAEYKEWCSFVPLKPKACLPNK